MPACVLACVRAFVCACVRAPCVSQEEGSDLEEDAVALPPNTVPEMERRAQEWAKVSQQQTVS